MTTDMPVPLNFRLPQGWSFDAVPPATRINVDGQPAEVMQGQVFVALPDTQEHRERANLQFGLTATMAQPASEFEHFMDSVEPQRNDAERVPQ